MFAFHMCEVCTENVEIRWSRGLVQKLKESCGGAKIDHFQQTTWNDVFDLSSDARDSRLPPLLTSVHS